MDDTEQGRKSDAAATRKRRSSILKAQRVPRAPLSELEFNVATPTDTAKSRRVSFSRRTGVAEFVTNEATTTWKNFYEEHNKSLESSGNESAANQHRPTVGHLGKRIFEYQFQEVELTDIGSRVAEASRVETSISNVKFDKFTLECSADDRKLAAPGQNFEFSAFTVSEQPSQLFADDLAISGLGEITDKINVNFSTMQPIGDDLDEIEKDFKNKATHQTNPQNVSCPDPQSGRHIEVDLNVTHVACAEDANALLEDMSITDTIHSPKVNVSKNSVCGQNDKSLDKDCDKENIAINPYVMPKESTNFAINEDSDKILVFDGKRATFQSAQETIIDYRKILIPNELPDKPPQRKTIVLNVDDDLPNYVANPHTSVLQNSKNYSLVETLDNDCEISLTQALPAKIETNSSKHQTIVFEDSSGNISMTQALPTNLELKKLAKQATIVFDNDATDISVTQAVPANIIDFKQNEHEKSANLRKTLVFEDDTGNISMTQAVPTNVILGKTEPIRKTLVFEDDTGNISMTQAVPTNVILGKTEPVPVDIDARIPCPVVSSIKPKSQETFVYDDDEDGNVSLTKVVPSTLLNMEVVKLGNRTINGSESVLSSKLEQQKRKTIVFNNANNNISMTNVIPSSLLNMELVKQSETTTIESEFIPSLKPEQQKRKTIVFNDEDGNISVTNVIPSSLLNTELVKQSNKMINENEFIPSSKPEQQKRKTILFNDEDGNVSVTNVIPSSLLNTELVKRSNKMINESEFIPSSKPEQQKRKTILFNDEDGNVSVTNVITSSLLNMELVKQSNKIINESEFLPSSKPEQQKRKTILFNDQDGNVSVTNVIPSSLLNTESVKQRDKTINESDFISFSKQEQKRKTIVFNDEDGNISITKPVPSNSLYSQEMSQRLNEENFTLPYMLVLEPESEKHRTKVFDDEDRNISLSKAIPSSNIMLNSTKTEMKDNMHIDKDSNKSTVNFLTSMLENADSVNIDISMTEVLPSNIIAPGKRKTIVFADDSANVSVTQTVPANLMSQNNTTGRCNASASVMMIETIEEDMIEHKSMALEDNHQPSATNPIFSDTKHTYENSSVGNLEFEPKDFSLSAPIEVALLEQKDGSEKRKLHENKTDDISITSDVPNHIITDKSSNNLDPNRIDLTITEEKGAKNEIITNSENGIEETEDNQCNEENKDNKSCQDMRQLQMGKLFTDSVFTKVNTHLQNIMVYQNVNITNTPFMENVIQEQESMLSTISSSNGKIDSEMEQSAPDDKVINAEYVTVSHRVPVPVPKPISEKDEKPLPSTASEPTLTSERDLSSFQNLNHNNRNADPGNECSELVSTHTNTVKKSCSDINYSLIQTDSAVDEIQKNIEKSILHDLLNMEENESGSGIVDKSVTVVVSHMNIPKTSSNSTTKTDSNDLFFITKDDEDDEADKFDSENIPKSDLSSSLNPSNKSQLESLPPIQLSVGTNNEGDKTLKSTKNRYFETVVRKSQNDLEPINCSNQNDLTNFSRPTKDANSTRDLLEMLSKFTEKEEEENPIKPTVEGRDSSGAVPARPGLRRLSVALSREDLINNISMAQAVLRDSEGTEPDDTPPSDTDDTPSPKNNVRLSSEVVRKTLRFEDDDSFTETRDISTVMTTPLKKTAFGESSYMRDECKKGNVIPSYLKDVSDGIKSLITELVKPMVDEMPFSGAAARLERESTCSVQANLVTSSQVDLEPERNGTIKTLKGIIKPYLDHLHSEGSDSTDENVETQSGTSESSTSHAPVPVRAINRTAPAVIQFDPENPLNNVLVAPFDIRKAHRYRPPRPKEDPTDTQDDLSNEDKPNTHEDRPNNHEDRPNVSFKDVESTESDNVSVQYHVHKVIPNFPQPHKFADTSNKQQGLSINNTSTVDQAIETINKTIKEEGINTDIAMQDNQKLLKYISSLTLDESVTGKRKSETRTSKSPKNNSQTLNSSEVEVIYKQETDLTIKLESDTLKNAKRKHKKSNTSGLEATPTPVAKMLKRSLSPVDDERKHEPDAMSIETENSEESSQPKSSPMQLGTDPSGAPRSSSDSAQSKDIANLESLSSMCVACADAPAEWRPELVHELSSKALVAEADCPDVARAIDCLPFMGSNECAWESATDNVWSFLLMHQRLRLTVRLARTRDACDHVRASARVKEIAVEQAQDVPKMSERDSSGALCMRFVAQAMRRACAGVARAGDVPRALRACAGLARVGARWRTAMRHAWRHVAYTLDPDGVLILTVANSALRCVWEVRLRIEMADNEFGEACPVAAGAEACTLAGAEAASARDLARATRRLAHDWGHAPRAIWKIFHYLKNKTYGDNIL